MKKNILYFISHCSFTNLPKLISSGCFILLLLFPACNGKGKKGNDQEAAVNQDIKNKKTPEMPAEKYKNIIFFGNSLTAGYGVGLPESFPSLIQARIDSLKLHYSVVNAGLSGETSSGGKSRIDWILRQPVDIFILESGGNDGLRGVPMSETIKNLQSIIDKVREKNDSCKIILAGMQIPPNMGKKYTTEFRTVYQQLAKKNNTYLIPFLLEGVGGMPELNQPDGIHPNQKGHQLVAENVWKALEPIL